LENPHTAGLVESLAGGRIGYPGHPHCLYYGRRVCFALPAIITVGHTTSHSGPIRPLAQLLNREKLSSVKIPSPYPSECSPIFHVYLTHISHISFERCMESIVVHGSGYKTKNIRL
jgi:hypothetical protein